MYNNCFLPEMFFRGEEMFKIKVMAVRVFNLTFR